MSQVEIFGVNIEPVTLSTEASTPRLTCGDGHFRLNSLARAMT